MWLLWLSFVAGILTVLAPCVLPLLPVIIGGSAKWWKKSNPAIIIASFAISILFFTLMIKVFADKLGIFPSDITKFSAFILILFGLVLLFPQARQWIMHKTGIERATTKAHIGGSKKKGVWWDIALWAVLGPIFNTCSPTYAILIANVLPASFIRWLTNIVAYIVWLSIVLWAIAYGGRAVVNKLKRASNPRGWFKKIIAWLLILVWVAILMKRDKKVEIWLIQNDRVIDTTQREIDAVKKVQEQDETTRIK